MTFTDALQRAATFTKDDVMRVCCGLIAGKNDSNLVHGGQVIVATIISRSDAKSDANIIGICSTQDFVSMHVDRGIAMMIAYNILKDVHRILTKVTINIVLNTMMKSNLRIINI